MQQNKLAIFFVAMVLAACSPPAAPSAPTELSQSSFLLQVAEIQLSAARAAHTATLLPDGRVLIAGGFAANEHALAGAELFDPQIGVFVPAASMTTPRQSHTATLLPNGLVLIAGGIDGDYLASAELYDPATNAFTKIDDMISPRSGHTATLLHDGTVLIVGGVGTGWTFLDSAELYDPATKTFRAVSNISVPRESHTASLLPNGEVLISGGHSGRRANIIIYASAEIYDPTTGSFRAAGEMNAARHKHEAVVLQDGRVLIAGGADERDDQGQYSSAEIYDPSSGLFTLVGDMNASRYKFYGTSVVLADARVLLLGGAAIVELFDPTTSSFAVSDGPGTTRLFATATLLQDGSILFVGGYGTDTAASKSAWVITP